MSGVILQTNSGQVKCQVGIMSRQQTVVGLPDLCVTASPLPQCRREVEDDGNQPPRNADRSSAIGFEHGFEVAVFEQVHRECAAVLNDLNLFSEHNPGRLTRTTHLSYRSLRPDALLLLLHPAAGLQHGGDHRLRNSGILQFHEIVDFEIVVSPDALILAIITSSLNPACFRAMISAFVNFGPVGVEAATGGATGAAESFSTGNLNLAGFNGTSPSTKALTGIPPWEW